MPTAKLASLVFTNSSLAKPVIALNRHCEAEPAARDLTGIASGRCP
jgi:hypothetical protein